MNRRTVLTLACTAAVATWLVASPDVRADPVADICYLFCPAEQDDTVGAFCSSFCSSSSSLPLPTDPQSGSQVESQNPTRTTDTASRTSEKP